MIFPSRLFGQDRENFFRNTRHFVLLDQTHQDHRRILNLLTVCNGALKRQSETIAKAFSSAVHSIVSMAHSIIDLEFFNMIKTPVFLKY